VTHPCRAALAGLVLALGTTACGSATTSETASLKDRIQIAGEFGKRPTIDIRGSLEIPETSSWVTKLGKGERIGTDSTSILQLTLADARTGKTALSTFDEGRRPLEVKLDDQVFPALVKELIGKPADTRVVVASSADDAYGDSGAPQFGVKSGDPVVMVVDILSTDPTSVLDGPTGATQQAPATAPKVKVQDGLPVGFDFTGVRKPRKLVVIPLRHGTGPVVESPSRIAADYIGQVWKAKQPYGETFSKEPARLSIGSGGGVKAWDHALVGLREGARVMILTPPAFGYGASSQPNIPTNSTLVFIVDILGVG
jgi:peptidylprolyl isomerase